MSFINSYEDTTRAESYAKLEFPGTYYLAYRDLPEIYARHTKGNKALDFGCGTGRSTRFLKKHGYRAIGIDISPQMVKIARESDPTGDYRLNAGPDFSALQDETFDLITSIFTFDNIPTHELKLEILTALRNRLSEDGIFVSLVSRPEIYVNEWASFSTKVFPGNFVAKCGDIVRTIMKDVPDQRPVEDVLCPDENYRELFASAGLEYVHSYAPLAKEDEPYDWVNETRIAPWMIYVLKRNKNGSANLF